MPCLVFESQTLHSSVVFLTILTVILCVQTLPYVHAFQTLQAWESPSRYDHSVKTHDLLPNQYQTNRSSRHENRHHSRRGAKAVASRWWNNPTRISLSLTASPELDDETSHTRQNGNVEDSGSNDDVPAQFNPMQEYRSYIETIKSLNFMYNAASMKTEDTKSHDNEVIIELGNGEGPNLVAVTGGET